MKFVKQMHAKYGTKKAPQENFVEMQKSMGTKLTEPDPKRPRLDPMKQPH